MQTAPKKPRSSSSEPRPLPAGSAAQSQRRACCAASLMRSRATESAGGRQPASSLPPFPSEEGPQDPTSSQLVRTGSAVTPPECGALVQKPHALSLFLKPGGGGEAREGGGPPEMRPPPFSGGRSPSSPISRPSDSCSCQGRPTDGLLRQRLSPNSRLSVAASHHTGGWHQSCLPRRFHRLSLPDDSKERIWTMVRRGPNLV